MRDDKWLEDQLKLLLEKHFSNVEIANPIEVKWGRAAKFRFGSIKLLKPRGVRILSGFRTLKKVRENRPRKSVITITSIFKDEKVPVKVVQYTIAHELCHYAHGFSSANKRLFKHPHHGGVINKELKERDAQDLIVAFKAWLKDYRSKILTGKLSINFRGLKVLGILL